MGPLRAKKAITHIPYFFIPVMLSCQVAMAKRFHLRNLILSINLFAHHTVGVDAYLEKCYLLLIRVLGESIFSPYTSQHLEQRDVLLPGSSTDLVLFLIQQVVPVI